MIEIGDILVFEGNPLTYMFKLREVNAEKTDVIVTEYTRYKNKVY